MRLFCSLVDASVNSLASFHAVRAVGCLFGNLVQLVFMPFGPLVNHSASFHNRKTSLFIKVG